MLGLSLISGISASSQEADTLYLAEYNLKAIGKYKNDLPDGFWTYYYVEGRKQSAGNYLNGKLSGKWTNWYPNGKLEHEKIYAADTLVEVIRINDTTGVELDCAYYWYIGFKLFEERQNSEADLYYEKAIRNCPDTAQYVVFSTINKWLINQEKEAIANLTNYIDRFPDNPDLLTTRAETYLLEERYEESLSDLNMSIELGSRLTKNYRLKGDTLESLGRYDEAVKAYEKYISTFPPNSSSEDKTEIMERIEFCKEKLEMK